MSTRIQIKRGTTEPTGLTTGEFAYNTTNSRLYIGNTADQKWIGGEVTGGIDMGAGSAASQNRVPTQNAVYEYARRNFAYSVNGITGPVGITSGSANLTITRSGNTLTISATDAIGVTAGDAVVWTQLQRFTAGISANGATLSGTVTAPTQAIGTNNTTVATTAFVQNEIIADTVTSFNGRTGAVQGVSAAVAGDGISVSGSTGSVTFTNTGVTRAVAGTGISVNTNTGTVTITNTGVQSFNGLTGAVGGVCAAVANTFTALQTFTTGISANTVNAEEVNTDKLAPRSSDPFILLGGGADNGNANLAGLQFGSDSATYDLRYMTLMTSELTQGQTLMMPNDSGTIALTKNLMGAVNGSTAATTAVTSFNGRTGAVQGVSSAAAGDGISVSGATGAVTITNTGVTRAVAGTGISVNANTGTVTITNNGVTSLSAGTGVSVSASTGSVTVTNTGVQSFNGRTGSIQGVSAAVAGDGISVSGATGSVTFTNTGVTRAVAGTGISVNANTGTVTITNSGALLTANTFTGLQSFTAGISAAGGITLASPNLTGTPTATTAAVGTNTTQIATTAFVQSEIVADTVTSFNGRTGAVQGVSAAVAGNGISVSGATGAVTITNTGVTRAVAGTGISVNANTGTVTITNSGALLSANTFTGLQTFTAGISAAGGITLTSPYFTGAPEALSLRTGKLVHPSNQNYITIQPSTSPGSGSLRFQNETIDPATYYATVTATSNTSDTTIVLPPESGTLALTKNVVTSFNGRTGAIQGVSAAVAGDGISVSGATGSVTFTNTGVTRAVAGTGISVNANTGTVTITNSGALLTANTFTGLQTFTGGISAASGITLASPNLTGTPTATTAAVGTNTTQIATTAFVQSEIIADTVTSFNGRTGAVQGVSAAVAGDGISVSGATGSVTFTNSGVTRAVAGTGISVNTNTGTVTITNSGALLTANTFTGLQTFTGGISAASGITIASPNLTGTPTATTAAVGTNTTQIATTAFVQSEIIADTVTSFNGRTGAVQGVSAAVAGDGISVSGATGAVTITNSGVTRAVAGTGISVNANTGTVTITNSGVTSISAGTGISVNASTGSVTVTNTGASLGTNTFSGLQTSASGFSGPLFGTADNANQLGGVAASGYARTGLSNTFSQTQIFTNSTLGISAGIVRLVEIQPATSSNLVTVEPSVAASGQWGFRLFSSNGLGADYFTTLRPSVLSSGITVDLPTQSGTLALTSSLMGAVNGSTAATTAVTSFNGRTGAVQGVSAAVAGDGISVSGSTGSVTFTNTGVTRAVAGTGISVNANTGTVTITNNGVTSISAGTGISVNASTGSVTVTNTGASLGTNTFTGLQTLTAGLSAAGGITFNGAITGATATFTRNLNVNQTITAGRLNADRISINSSIGQQQDITTFNGVISLDAPTDTVDGGGGYVSIGDANNAGNSTLIFVNDENQSIELFANGSVGLYGPISGYNADFGIQQDPSNGPSVTGRNGVAIGAGAISAKTSGYTLTAADNGKVVTFNSASALVCGIGTASGATGFSCTIIQLGTGGVRFAASGVTLNSFNGLTLAGQHASASVVCYQTNVLNVSGNLIG